jgi:hypothetical protein
MIDEIHGPRGITDGEVRLETRKGWRDWVEILNDWDTKDKRFSPTLRHLTINHGLNYHWAQIIAVYYVRKHSQTGDLSHSDF